MDYIYSLYDDLPANRCNTQIFNLMGTVYSRTKGKTVIFGNTSCTVIWISGKAVQKCKIGRGTVLCPQGWGQV